MSKSKPKKLTTMTTEELAAATEDLDAELAIDDFGPMSEDADQKWKRAKRKRGRPKQGKGVKVISVSLEKDLILKSDKLAKSLGISRSALIARGLEAALALAGEED